MKCCCHLHTIKKLGGLDRKTSVLWVSNRRQHNADDHRTVQRSCIIAKREIETNISEAINLIFFPQQLLQSRSLFIISAPGSRQLVYIAYYLILRFLLMYSISALSTDVFS